MHRIDTPTALPGGVFTEGDPMVPVPATEVSDDWLNAVQEEIAAVIVAAGIELDKKDNAQLAAVFAYIEAFRKSWLLTPRPWRSTTLPANHAWANGDAILLADWPEAKAIVDVGGLDGMLLPSDSSAAIIAANLGKFRLSSDGLLYLPNLSNQFLRAWGPGLVRTAGSYQGDAMRNLTGSIDEVCDTKSGLYGSWYMSRSSQSTAFPGSSIPTYAKTGVTFSASYQVPTDAEFRPANVAQPVIIYLGRQK
jgi:hypothetical protein